MPSINTNPIKKEASVVLPISYMLYDNKIINTLTIEISFTTRKCHALYNGKAGLVNGVMNINKVNLLSKTNSVDSEVQGTTEWGNLKPLSGNPNSYSYYSVWIDK
jgi:hypothetical protein